jgi:hypothetical protein
MMNDRFLGNTRYTNQILKLDQAYVHSLCLNYYGDSYVERVHRVLSTPYVKPEFECDLCFAGNHKRGKRPAAFIPTKVGYVFTCLNCTSPGISLYQYLQNRNQEIADNYRFDRWVKKLSGSGFNCPDPPKNIKREYYQRIEEELKEKNKLEYQRKNDLI